MFCRRALPRANGPSQVRLSAGGARTRSLPTYAPLSRRKYGTAAATVVAQPVTIANGPSKSPLSCRSLATRAAAETNPKNIAVIGGGITGLTTAHYLAKHLPEDSNITVYESSDRLGGWMDTQRVDFTHEGRKSAVQFERGPRTLRSYAKDVWKMDDLVLYDLLNDIGIEPTFVRGSRRFINIDNRLVPVSLSSLFSDPALRSVWKSVVKGFIRLKRSRLGGYDKLKSLREGQRGNDKDARKKQPPADMSVGDFLRMVCGESAVVDKLASAVMHGVWGGDIDRLSMPAVMPRLWWTFWYKESRHEVFMPEHEHQLLESMRGNSNVQSMVSESARGQLVTFPEGLGSIPRAIVEGLEKKPNVKIIKGTPVTKLQDDVANKKVLLSTQQSSTPLPYDKVISSIDSKRLYSLAPAELPSLASAEAVTITAVNLWYPKAALNAPNRGVGYLCPRRDSSFHDADGLLGVFFDSDAVPPPAPTSRDSKSSSQGEEQAAPEPQGTKLFVLMRGARPEAEAVSKAREVLAAHLNIDPSEPAVVLARTNHDCIPQHLVGHRDFLARTGADLASSFGGRLAVAGPSYTCAGVVGSARAGHDVAAQVALGTHEHVGHTGLAQFQRDHVVRLTAVPRKALRDIGRKIPEIVPAWVQWLR